MRVDQFDFELPEACIALRPAEPRNSARMLIAGASGAIEDGHVRDMVDRLQPGDVVVFNDTRVIPAELHGVRKRGSLQARIQVTLHKRIDGANWRAFARPAKKLKVGDQVSFGDDGNTCFAGRLDAAITGKHDGGEVTLAFEISDTYLDDAIQALGHIPLPPYIASRRGQTDADKADYQTIYARHDGAVAAPTAGLHFDAEMLVALNARGIEHMFVTLHVGAGTFLPVKVDDTNDHRMHSEWGDVTAEVAARLNKVRADGGRIVAVGTTSLRLLETAVNENGVFAEYCDDTDIFITPGYEFRAVDILLTNFHLPRSTLFMLVSAFSGLEPMRAVYRHAIDAGYRFYSYGDACLLYRREAGT